MASIVVGGMRTEELDRHWSGMFYCLNCQHYTGYLMNHQGHNVMFVDSREPNGERARTVSLVPFLYNPAPIHGNLVVPNRADRGKCDDI